MCSLIRKPVSILPTEYLRSFSLSSTSSLASSTAYASHPRENDLLLCCNKNLHYNFYHCFEQNVPKTKLMWRPGWQGLKIFQSYFSAAGFRLWTLLWAFSVSVTFFCSVARVFEDPTLAKSRITLFILRLCWSSFFSDTTYYFTAFFIEDY